MATQKKAVVKKTAPKKTVAKKASTPKVETKKKPVAKKAVTKKPVEDKLETIKKGSKLACQVCGFALTVDRTCGTVEETLLICCETPMKHKRPAARK